MRELVKTLTEAPGLVILLSAVFGLVVFICNRYLLGTLLKMHRSKTAVKKIEKQYTFTQKFLLHHVRDHCVHAKKFCRRMILLHHMNLIITLLVCATVMPLLGVLGTLLSLVNFYEQPGVTDGAAAPPMVAETLQRALMLSASGIALAIPAYLFYMYLASRARKLINQVERAGLECVHIIADAREDALLKQAAEEAKAALRGCMAPAEEDKCEEK